MPWELHTTGEDYWFETDDVTGSYLGRGLITPRTINDFLHATRVLIRWAPLGQYYGDALPIAFRKAHIRLHHDLDFYLAAITTVHELEHLMLRIFGAGKSSVYTSRTSVDIEQRLDDEAENFYDNQRNHGYVEAILSSLYLRDGRKNRRQRVLKPVCLKEL